MHPEQKKWCEYVKKVYSHYFIDRKVLDVGSLDINGNNRYLFTDCDYVGVDVVAGKNVDVVKPAHELEFDDGTFDVVMSTNALEHDIHFPKTLKKMFNLTRSGGLLFFQACHKWHEHGTIKTTPYNSGTSQLTSEWSNYYKNIEMEDVMENLDLDNFENPSLSVLGKDICFVGVKK